MSQLGWGSLRPSPADSGSSPNQDREDNLLFKMRTILCDVVYREGPGWSEGLMQKTPQTSDLR